MLFRSVRINVGPCSHQDHETSKCAQMQNRGAVPSSIVVHLGTIILMYESQSTRETVVLLAPLCTAWTIVSVSACLFVWFVFLGTSCYLVCDVLLCVSISLPKLYEHSTFSCPVWGHARRDMGCVRKCFCNLLV